MNKEEKEAYNYLEKYIEWETLGERNLEDDIKTILDLIKKQQNKIEDLKAITREYESYQVGEGNKIMIASKEWFADGFFKNFLSNYISKDKIKEKIEYYHKQREKAETEKINDMFVNYIDCLEELLQGGQESDQEGGQENE